MNSHTGHHRTSATAHWLALAVVLCTLEGACRKWLMPDSNPAVQAVFYFAKDVAFLLAALTAANFPASSAQVRQLRQALAVTTVLVWVASIISFSGATLVGGLLSLRSMVVVPWLAVLAAPGLRSQKDLEQIVKTVGFLAIGVAALGVCQFYLPADHVLNRQPEMSASATVAMGRVRASGTFSFISGMATMAVGATWAGTYMLLVQARQKLGYLFVLTGLVCASAVLSRSGFFFSVALLGSALLLSRAGARPAIFLAVILSLAWLIKTDEAHSEEDVGIVTGIIARQTRSDTIFQRAMGMIENLLSAFTDVPLGHGLGTGQQGGEVAESGIRKYLGHESETARIVCELGVIGLLGVALCRVSLAAVLWKALMRVKPEPTPLDHMRRVSLVAIGTFFVSNTCFDHVASGFAWIIATAALATFEIEANERRVPTPSFAAYAAAPRSALAPHST